MRATTARRPGWSGERMAAWMEIESCQQALEREESEVEDDARRLEAAIRALVRNPRDLAARRGQLEKQALSIRDRRERILATRRDLERKREAFWGNRPEPSRATPALVRQPAERVRMAVSVSPVSEHNFWSGLLQDIDEGGLFIATREHLVPGTPLDLALSIPGQPILHLAGEVCWVREDNEFTADLTPGVGVRLHDLTEEARGSIHRFFEIREPLLVEMA